MAEFVGDAKTIWINGVNAMNRIKPVSCMLLIGILAGCASFTSPARKHELDASKPSWLDYDAYRRGALFVPISTARGKTFRTCAEPSPDVALQLADKFTAKGGNGEVSAEASAEISQNALVLAQRTQMIQFLRESLFRLCEINMNVQLPPADVASMYQKVIDSAKAMAEAEKATAQKAATDAAVRLLNKQKESSAFIDAIKKKAQQDADEVKK